MFFSLHPCFPTLPLEGFEEGAASGVSQSSWSASSAGDCWQVIEFNRDGHPSRTAASLPFCVTTVKQRAKLTGIPARKIELKIAGMNCLPGMCVCEYWCNIVCLFFEVIYSALWEHRERYWLWLSSIPVLISN